MDPSIAALGFAIAKVVMRFQGRSEVADALDDLHGSVKGTRQSGRRDRLEPVGREIARNLESALPHVGPDETDDLRAAAKDVTLLISRFANDGDASLAAVLDPAAFRRWAQDHGGGQLRSWTNERAQPFFDKLLDAACTQFAELAPSSPLLLSAGLKAILAETGAIPELVQRLEPLSRVSSGLTEAALADRDAHLRRSLPNWVVAASISATERGRRGGIAIGRWDPVDLGVRPTTLGDAQDVGVTPYVLRPHDGVLRGHLRESAIKSQSLFLLAVGTSSTGKTRAMHEALLSEVPDWGLIAPETADDLREALASGIPAQTVIWLDELQLRISRHEAPNVAPALLQLLATSEEKARPIVVAATVWRVNLHEMHSRSSPTAAAAGADSLPRLIDEAIVVPILDVFSEAERSAAIDSGDSRLCRAAEASTRSDAGWQVTQTLVGAPSLIARVDEMSHSSGASFSLSAKAVLHGAADLRRVGLENPLPRWAIEESAPGYLDDSRPVTLWIDHALRECTADAATDDSVMGETHLDFLRRGVPALRPRWIRRDRDGSADLFYELHEILLQHHLQRHGRTATAEPVWESLVRHRDELDASTRGRVAAFARDRAMFSLARALETDPILRVGISAERGDPDAIRDLTAIARSSSTDGTSLNPAADELVGALLRSRNLAAIRELIESSDAWLYMFKTSYVSLLFEIAVSDLGARSELERLAPTSLYISGRLAAVRPGWDRHTGWRDELAATAATGNWYAKAEVEDFAAFEGDPDALQRLRDRAGEGSVGAMRRLARLEARKAIASMGPLASVSYGVANGVAAQGALISAWAVQLSRREHTTETLAAATEAANLGWPGAAWMLLSHYRSLRPRVRELDCILCPV